ncbi:hypothetical protein MAF45_02415 [Mesosutterella sp. OilRF-GAM-744-9]|uniref:Uncharacterized protein n=1 Tax=Mesosutterella porci TaxID=2915351 RepID=A0ABS9MNX3_9BURK|nr:hypothetical protein [Mesosutterella sp. oilRF-744-WT-GAM-9]MCG5030310.1 hypothetical protein [Mesosutterella sp. oilRF-744-WT-GAM-9]
MSPDSCTSLMPRSASRSPYQSIASPERSHQSLTRSWLRCPAAYWVAAVTKSNLSIFVP